mmetsp:Transcript_17743/g.28348  ORF Transcript_17743/g.28348 Transcript_17743/m.28348 type:complete len:372 (-) Transcript_17743:24-1139(-)
MAGTTLNARFPFEVVEHSNGNGNGSDSDSSRYVVERTLGSGAFGTVYLVHLEGDGDQKQYALKQTHQDCRYKNREGDILKLVSHQGIVQVFDVFYVKYKHLVYLNVVMEYLPQTLNQLIESKKQRGTFLCHQDIRWYALQLLRTCGYLAQLNLSHRDIKPQNILVNHEKRVIKLCDFGSAKQLNDDECNKHYICSRFYRAPELLCKSMHYSCAVDLWSVGTCMAEMYLSYPLFNGGNTEQQLRLIRNVLGPLPPNYPSRTRTVYEGKHGRCGRASVQKWKSVLNIERNYKHFAYDASQPASNAFPDLQFVQLILQYNPDKRPNLSQTLKHAYFRDLVSPDRHLSDAEPDGHSIYPRMKWTPHELAILHGRQ